MNKILKFLQSLFFKTTLIKENNVTFLLWLLMICIIPFPNFINTLVFVIVILYSIVKLKYKHQIVICGFLLILLFIWMSLTCFWSVEKQSSLKALFKESYLFFLPICFLIIHIKSKEKLIKYYSITITFYTVFFLIRALFFFINGKNINVFFSHELVTKELNAVHFSVFVSLALFYFLVKAKKEKWDYLQLLLLSVFLVLLGSKIIILTDVILLFIYFFFYSKSANKMRLRNITLVVALIFSFFFFNNIREKIEFEFQLNKDNNIGHTVIPKEIVGENIISMKEAWEKERFEQTDFFSGASFRVYQFRMFLEIMKEEDVFFQGLGLNASYKKLEEKGIKYNIFNGNSTTEGYQKKNFHNQYIQVFAELGLIGFVILVLIVLINLKNAFATKDFLHIAFAILMLSLFLTESFLWRQRGVVFFTVFYCIFNSKEFLNNKQ